MHRGSWSVLAFLSAAIAVLAPSSVRAQFGPSVVAAATAEEIELEPPQRFVGTVMPRRRSVIGSAVENRVTEYLVRKGEWVREGQPIAQLLTETLEIELAGAEAELELRKHEYDELRNGSRPEEIMQSRAKVEQTKALSEFAAAKQKRWRGLFEKGQGGTSQDEFEQVNSAALAAEQLHLAAKAEYQLVEQGPRKEKIAQAYAKLNAQQEAVKLLQDKLSKHTIKAPFNGYIVRECTEVGSWIKNGDQVAEVIELDWIEIEVAVPEDRIPGLQQAVLARKKNGEAAPATVDLSAVPGGGFTAHVKHIVPQADLRSRTFPVKVEMENPKIDGSDEENRMLVFHAGMLANVTLPVGKKQKSLVVPKDALVLGGPSPVVYVIGPDPMTKGGFVVRPVNVKTGLSQGERIQVIGELKAGDQVVIRGNERLRPGQAVMVTAGKP